MATTTTMTELQPALTSIQEHFLATAPKEITAPISKARADFIAAYQPSRAIQPGEMLPPFALPDALGRETRSADLLAKGPLLITFYRGEWCPFCDLAVAALQKRLPDLQERGVTLVAISPELPDQSLTTIEKHNLQFPVLSDRGNGYARQLGLLWKMPDELRPVFAKFGADLPKRNGDDSLEVPVPATLLVDEHGVVRNTFVDADYTKRCEPQEMVEWIDAMQKTS